MVDDGKRLVGMVSLGDLAACRSPDVEGTLRAISEPSEPDRPPTRSSRSRIPWTGYGEAPYVAFAPLGGRYAED